jgi:ABC-2 type transport system permease protein
MIAAEAIEAPIRARRAGFLRDLLSVAGRAVRALPRQPESVIPGIIIPAFFFIVNTGSLERLTEAVAGGPSGRFDYRAFQLPVAIAFAVTGISQAAILVMDIQGGYFDRLLATPVHRLALLLGLMIADVVMVMVLCLPVILTAFFMDIQFATGTGGILMFIALAAVWGLAFSGVPYAIALKTGNPAAVNTSFILFFPFLFLTTAFAPREFLSGWLDTAATYNPVTYLLEGLRALIMEGWVAADLIKAFLAVGVVGAISMSMALLSLRGRVKRA